MCRLASCVEPGEGAGAGREGWSGSQGSPLSSPQTQLRLWGEAGTRPPAGLSPRQGVSAFPALLLLFGKEVATVVVPVALGHFSPLLPQCVYDSGVCFFFFFFSINLS